MSMISPAFQDAVHDSQQCFRLLLKAMSEPGTVVTLNRCEGFGSMMSAAAQTLLSMADNATPIWLSSTLKADHAVTENIKFHIGAPIVEQTQQASFAAISAQDLHDVDWSELTFNLGNEEYPDTSTTVVIEVDSLTSGTELSLSGPGIQSEQAAFFSGLPAGFIAHLKERQSLVKFPLGVDFIFVANQQALCLPRTTKVEATTCTLL
ncbi:phosphonate C-P lyase system protein PhnH [Vibrio coralliirubri]|uniref:phosphonate C-P lyase system protein PhnH n=1 Tax=Vibrio coralliirubri TaxID=1516159 RepID=UPI002FE0B476